MYVKRVIIVGINEYLEYEVVTTIRTIRPANITFPSVTLCINRPNNLRFITTDFDQEPFNDEYQFSYFNLNCFVFNSGKELETNQSLLVQTGFGRDDGMYLSMEVLGRDLDDIELTFLVQDNNELAPYRIISGQNLAIGQSTRLVLKKTENLRLGKPYNDCYNNLNSADSFDSDFYRKTINNTFDYRRINCYELCAAIELSRECNCSTPGLFLTDQVDFCNRRTRCVDRFLKDFDYAENCEVQCPQQCDSITYEASIQTSTYMSNTPDRMNYAMLFPGRQINESTALSVEVYFAELRYEEIEEQENITTIEFIANIGGHLGLFLGLSLLSFSEVFELFFIIISIIRGDDLRIF